MSPAFRLSRAHRQNGLRAIQRLNLRLLVNAQYQRLIRRIQVESDDISHFVDEQRIRGKFETLTAVRRQSESPPHAMHAAPTQAASCRQRARAPVRSMLRSGLQSHSQHFFHFLITEPSRCPRSWFIQQTINAFIHKAAAPFANRLLGHAQPRRDLRITLALGTRQNDARPLGQRLHRLRSSRPLLQRLAFVVGQAQNWFRSSHSYQFLLILNAEY